MGLPHCSINILTFLMSLFNKPKVRRTFQNLPHLILLNMVFAVNLVDDLRQPDNP